MSEEHKILPELTSFLAKCWNRIWEALIIKLIFDLAKLFNAALTMTGDLTR